MNYKKKASEASMVPNEIALHLHPDIVSRLDKLEKDGGITLSKLAVGTKIIAKTRNTEYHIEVIDPKQGLIMVEGNKKYCPFPIKARLNGSTWGTSMIKIDWIGKDMHMEMLIFNPDDTPRTTLTTTSVQEATLIGPDDSWRFKLWE